MDRRHRFAHGTLAIAFSAAIVLVTTAGVRHRAKVRHDAAARVAEALRANARPAPEQQGPDAATIVERGNGKGAAACTTCHGPKLLGDPGLGSPRLAGLNADYVASQLAVLADGSRKTPVMQPIATALTAAERTALARYVSGLPVSGPMPPRPDSLPAPTAEQIRLGERLATRGRWADTIPACDQCHGPYGVGVGTAFPPLAGQSSVYLANQLDAWKNGTRPPGPLGLMSAIAARMTEADIQAAAAYYPTLPVGSAEEGARRP